MTKLAGEERPHTATLARRIASINLMIIGPLLPIFAIAIIAIASEAEDSLALVPKRIKGPQIVFDASALIDFGCLHD